MKNIRSTGSSFDVIVGGVITAKVTPEWTMFDEDMAAFILKYYPQLVEAEDSTPADIIDNSGVKDASNDSIDGN